MAAHASASPGRKPQKQPSAAKRQPLYASDYDQSRFLKWQDLGEIGSSKTVTIRDVTEELLVNEQGQEEKKPCLWFNELEKGLILNATNRNTLRDAFGDAMHEWAGTVVVFSMMTDFRGKMTGALRVRIPANKPAAKKQK